MQEDPHQNWSLRAAADGDAHWIAELRALVLRPDLERLGRFDPVRVRQRFLSAFDPGITQVVLVNGQEAGSIAVRPDEGSLWLEHFYLRADCQGRGIGSLVLRQQLSTRQGDRPFRLNVLRGSRAQALYERHGFIVENQPGSRRRFHGPASTLSATTSHSDPPQPVARPACSPAQPVAHPAL